MGVNTADSYDETEDGLSVDRIPEDLTNELMLVIPKIINGRDVNQPLLGSLQNGPIEVGKPIILGAGNCTPVASIIKKDGVYFIRTQSGSEYMFDPSKSMETPDYLKD